MVQQFSSSAVWSAEFRGCGLGKEKTFPEWVEGGVEQATVKRVVLMLRMVGLKGSGSGGAG